MAVTPLPWCLHSDVCNSQNYNYPLTFTVHLSTFLFFIMLWSTVATSACLQAGGREGRGQNQPCQTLAAGECLAPEVSVCVPTPQVSLPVPSQQLPQPSCC